MNINQHWSFIETIAQTYPNTPNYQEIQDYKQFFVALCYIIPDRSYQRYLMIRPIDHWLDSKNSLMSWVKSGRPINGQSSRDQRIMNNSEIWNYLIDICKNYPQLPSFQKVLYYKNFFLTLQNVLPVRKIYQEKLKNLPVDRFLSSNHDLVMWINQLKKSNVVNYMHQPNVLEPFTSQPTKHNVILLTSLIVICGVAIYLKNRR